MKSLRRSLAGTRVRAIKAGNSDGHIYALCRCRLPRVEPIGDTGKSPWRYEDTPDWTCLLIRSFCSRINLEVLGGRNRTPDRFAIWYPFYFYVLVRLGQHLRLRKVVALPCLLCFSHTTFIARASIPDALSSAVARCIVSIASRGALYGGAPDSNVCLNSSKRDFRLVICLRRPFILQIL